MRVASVLGYARKTYVITAENISALTYGLLGAFLQTHGESDILRLLSKLEYKFQDKENSEDIFSFGSAMEDFICVAFVLDRNIITYGYAWWWMGTGKYLESCRYNMGMLGSGRQYLNLEDLQYGYLGVDGKWQDLQSMLW
ncbi:hypothetical protein Tco_0659016 [Tanacetum coccineum]